MKSTKRILSIVLTVMLFMSLATVAFAAETVSNNTNHDYKAYQIFAGTQGDGAALGDVVWGSGIAAAKTDALMTQLKKEAAFASCADAADVADVLATKSDNDAVVLKFAEIVSKYLSTTATAIAKGAKNVELAAGYYLLVDQTVTNGVVNEVKGLSLLQVTKDGNIVITFKTDKPTVDKEVWDEATDDDKEADENWGETADHDIGEEFQFRLTATIPANTMTHFDAYKIIFTDKMSAGLTFVKIDSVTVNGKASSAYTHTAKADQAGITWTLTMDDVKTAVSGVDTTKEVKVVVTYTAKLNADAVIHNPGNPNTVGLQYSNNPNVGGEGELGKTTEDTVWVFTYEISGTKVDGSDMTKTLAGAEFVLYKTVDGKNLYAVVDANNKLVKWEEATIGDDGKTVYPAGSVLTTKEDGKINVIGLDHGEYKLQEIKAPVGYNILTEPTDIIVNATHEEKSATEATTVYNEGSVTSVNIENQQGFTLPETGGMGTTMFYLFGGMLVMLAIVLLVTKKYMLNIK